MQTRRDPWILSGGGDVEEIVTELGKRQFLLTDVRAKQAVRVFASRWAMSYLRGPITLAEMDPLLKQQGTWYEQEGMDDLTEAAVVNYAPPLAAETPIIFGQPSPGVARPSVLLRNRLSVQRVTLDLYREIEECWKFPIYAKPTKSFMLEFDI